ncbi:MAG: hypothetical protein ACRYFZ_13675 [Janthinobacterium lividum]
MLLLWLLATNLSYAQPAAPVPGWVLATVATQHTPRLIAQLNASAVDEAGNVFIAGFFSDTLCLGNLTLYSAGEQDFFLAKYVPATNTWLWAVRGGGLASDEAYGLAVHQGSVYLTGSLQNNYLNDNHVTLDSTTPVPQLGAVNAEPSHDLFVAKYLDHGTRASLAWCQVAGGTGYDNGQSIAVHGARVYVTGMLTADQVGTTGVVFGGGGPLPGLYPQRGASAQPGNDMVLAAYTDRGTAATFDWSEVGGGTGRDNGNAVAVHGRSVYVAGCLTNSRTDTNRVRLGGHGRVPGQARQYGACARSSADWLLAKYTDLGDHAALGWSQVAGGTSHELAYSLAVQDSSVYLTGFVINSRRDSRHVRFGGSGTVAGTHCQRGLRPLDKPDDVLAKYTDHGPTGSCEWLRVDGPHDWPSGFDVVARGRWVYTTGYSFFNRTHTRQGIAGGTPHRVGTGRRGHLHYAIKDHAFVAGYYDEGPRATLRWVRAFDTPGQYLVNRLGWHGSRLYVVGNTVLPAHFGRFTLATLQPSYQYFVAALDVGAAEAAGPAGSGLARRRAR